MSFSRFFPLSPSVRPSHGVERRREWFSVASRSPPLPAKSERKREKRKTGRFGPIGPETAQYQLPHKVSSRLVRFEAKEGTGSRVSSARGNWMAVQTMGHYRKRSLSFSSYDTVSSPLRAPLLKANRVRAGRFVRRTAIKSFDFIGKKPEPVKTGRGKREEKKLKERFSLKIRSRSIKTRVCSTKRENFQLPL